VQQSGSVKRMIQKSGPDADKANSLMTYLTKLRETGKIQKDKKSAREAIERWKLGHAVAILTLDQKKLIIEELLIDSTVLESDQKSILDLINLSEVVHTKKLCDYLAPLIKDVADVSATNKKSFSTENYKQFQNIQTTRAKEAVTSDGTFSSNEVRFMIERAYINAIRYAEIHNVDSDFVKFSDGQNYLDCITTLKRVVLFNLYGKSLDFANIQKTVNEYCNGTLTDSLGAKRDNRIMDAMDAMISLNHAKKVGSFSFNQINTEYKGNVSGQKKKISKPDTLTSSVWKSMTTEIDNKEGWHVFTLTVLNGYHSITLLVNIRPGGPFLYWIDDLDKTKQPESEQFRVTEGSAPGERQLIPDQLDNYINWTTRSYWENERENTAKSDGKEGWHDENDTTILWQLNP
jgi:hypothetical protein